MTDTTAARFTRALSLAYLSVRRDVRVRLASASTPDDFPGVESAWTAAVDEHVAGPLHDVAHHAALWFLLLLGMDLALADRVAATVTAEQLAAMQAWGAGLRRSVSDTVSSAVADGASDAQVLRLLASQPGGPVSAPAATRVAGDVVHAVRSAAAWRAALVAAPPAPMVGDVPTPAPASSSTGSSDTTGGSDTSGGDGSGDGSGTGDGSGGGGADGGGGPASVEYLVWVTAGDERVRPAHADADGQQQPPGTPFDIGGYPARFPGDPVNLPLELSINCRCVLLSDQGDLLDPAAVEDLFGDADGYEEG